MRSKVFAILLAAALVGGGLGSFNYVNAQPLDDEVNIAEVNYSSWGFYTAPEDTFANREVTGITWWKAELWNRPDTTEEPIASPELSLDSDLPLDWASFSSTNTTLVAEGPPTYEWAFGGFDGLSQGASSTMFVHPTNPADDVPTSFTPGFNVSVSVDRVEFLQSEGEHQEQTLTITVQKVDPDAYFILVVSSDVTLFPFLPVDEGDLVEAVMIPPFPEWTDFVFPGGTGFIMDTMHLPAGDPVTYVLSIEVTPKVPSVEYKPAVLLFSQDEYPEHQSYSGNSHSFEVDSLGTWTWNAEGQYDWQWRYNESGAVLFPGISSAGVPVDIRPGCDPNSINLKSKGVVPVAVLTTDDFDASTVDCDTVLFAGAESACCLMEDVDGDGDLDMLFHFKTQELNLDKDSTDATLTGKTNDNVSIKGTDTVNIVP